MDDNLVFWKMAFDRKVIDKEYLKQVVKTDSNQFGEISPDQYKEICGEDFA